MNRMMRKIYNDIKVDDEPIVNPVRGRSKSVKAFSIRDELTVILTSLNNLPEIQTARKSVLSSISPRHMKACQGNGLEYLSTIQSWLELGNFHTFS